MIQVFKKIWNFSGSEKKKIRSSIVWGFINAIFYAMQLGGVFVVLEALISDNHDSATALSALGVMALSIVGQIVTLYMSDLQRTHAGYFMVANKRIRLGDRLKTVPMGYFNQNSLGDITAIATTTLSEVESMAPVVLVTTLGGFINAIVFALMVLLFDWRLGLIDIAGMLLFLVIVSAMAKKSKNNVPKRQAAQETLIDAVLETVQGMSVVKAFNLDLDKGKKVDHAIEQSCIQNDALEKTMNPFVAAQQIVLYLCSVLIVFVSIYFYLSGAMTLVYCLLMVIASFMIFDQLKAAGSGMATLRLTESAIDRANDLDDVPVMNEGTQAIVPASHEIRFNQVDFSYGERPVLESVSVTIPEKKMTAIVGPSGSGKTTMCSLIARFWDIQGGQISIGGRDVRDYTLDSLLANISMVFQNVYLFEDTIENNIKFGKPDATHEEVVEAAKRACCDDFIQALPDGYNTMIGEGGSALSGGEKQRLSIARAMLKDAPIVIFDEATASIDPENEDRLQAAIESLTRDKTIIMIAHRLKTVRNADQILVLDQGHIVQHGTHDELMQQKGLYADFIGARKQTLSWKL